jgi:hypothetical protein
MSQGFTKGIPIDYDGSLSANSDLLVSSQKAVKTYIDAGLGTKVNTVDYTLQKIYENSSPLAEIITDAIRGALSIQAGVSDTNNVFEAKNLANAVTTSIRGDGRVNSSSLTNTGVLAQLISRPVQITSNQNNYSTSLLSVLHLTTDASRDIRGFANGTDGKILIITNVGLFNIVLKQDSALSTANTRMLLGNPAVDVTILPNDSVTLQYDSTALRWRLISKSF